MSLDEQILRKIAHLSRLDLPEGSYEKMQRDFAKMVEFVEQLRTVDTTGVEPLTSMTQEVNRFRPDVVSEELSASEVFRNAPDHDGKYFRVPKVL